MDPADIESRFTYHPALDDARRGAHDSIRAACLALGEFLNGRLPEGREKALAVTNLEQLMFWANAAIARQPEA